MAYENETYAEQCTRIKDKLKLMCEQPADGKPCCARGEVDFEDCCTTCQAARTIGFAAEEFPRLVYRAGEADRLARFQHNVLNQV